jgi:hypothetical protein
VSKSYATSTLLCFFTFNRQFCKSIVFRFLRPPCWEAPVSTPPFLRDFFDSPVFPAAGRVFDKRFADLLTRAVND